MEAQRGRIEHVKPPPLINELESSVCVNGMERNGESKVIVTARPCPAACSWLVYTGRSRPSAGSVGRAPPTKTKAQATQRRPREQKHGHKDTPTQTNRTTNNNRNSHHHNKCTAGLSLTNLSGETVQHEVGRMTVSQAEDVADHAHHRKGAGVAGAPL